MKLGSVQNTIFNFRDHEIKGSVFTGIQNRPDTWQISCLFQWLYLCSVFSFLSVECRFSACRYSGWELSYLNVHAWDLDIHCAIEVPVSLC